MQELLEVGSLDVFMQNTRSKVCQMQWATQIGTPQRIRVVLQG